MTEFICPTCGKQKAEEFNGFVICPNCKKNLALGGIIPTQDLQQKSKYLEGEKKDLSDKFLVCKNEEMKEAIIERMKKNKEKLDELRNILGKI